MQKIILNLLEDVAKRITNTILSDLGVEFSKIDGEYFEDVFKKYCEEALTCEVFKEVTLEDIRGHKFPDFSLNVNGKKYGVEIKSSEKGKWSLPGNSVYENTITTNFENIFVFFGSYKEEKNAFEVAVTEYWSAVKGIKVTHSPRFEINVNKNSEINFFESWEDFISFKEMKKAKKTEFLQKFLREQKKGQNLWYVPSDEQEQPTPKLFEELDKNTKMRLLAECYILFFSDIFKAKKSAKSKKYLMDSYYGNITRYLLGEHFVHSSSVRDKFSSGGEQLLEVDGQSFRFPAVFQKFSILGGKIFEILTQLDNNELSDFKEVLLLEWRDLGVKYNKKSFLESYIDSLNLIENSSNLKFIIRQVLNIEEKTNVLSSQISLDEL